MYGIFPYIYHDFFAIHIVKYTTPCVGSHVSFPFPTWRIIPGLVSGDCKSLGSPTIHKPWKGHLEGEQAQLPTNHDS